MHLQWACTSKRRWTRPSWINFVAAGIIYLSSASLSTSPPVTLLVSPRLCVRAYTCKCASAPLKDSRSEGIAQVACLTALIWAGMRRQATSNPLTRDQPHCKHRDNVCACVSPSAWVEWAKGYPLASLNPNTSYLFSLPLCYLGPQSVPFSGQTHLQYDFLSIEIPQHQYPLTWHF